MHTWLFICYKKTSTGSSGRPSKQRTMSCTSGSRTYSSLRPTLWTRLIMELAKWNQHFSNPSSNRLGLHRRTAKSTQYIQPQTFAAAESVSYPAHVLQFHVRHFHVLHIGPSISCLSISCPAILMVRHFHVQHFQSTRSRPYKMLMRLKVLCTFEDFLHLWGCLTDSKLRRIIDQR